MLLLLHQLEHRARHSDNADADRWLGNRRELTRMQTRQRRAALFALRDLRRIDSADVKIATAGIEWSGRLYSEKSSPPIVGSTMLRRFRRLTSFSKRQQAASSVPGCCKWRGQNSSLRTRDNRRALWRDSSGRRAAFRDPIDRCQHTFAHIRFIGAHGQLHFHFIRNDVVLCSAVNRSNRHNNRIERIIFAACDGLPAR